VSIGRQPLDAGRVRVIITGEPGSRGFFGPVEIAGNQHVDDRIIRRRLAYLPGDVFTRRAIERSQQQIASLGLFKSVAIGAQNVDARPAEVPTRVTVEERSPWQWNLALGYAAGERLGLDARLSHLNLFGSARRLDIEGRVSRIERTAQLSFLQLDTWHPALSFSAQLRHQEIDERAFFVMSRGGQAAVRWEWTDALATTASYAVAVERSRVDSSLALLAGLQDGMLSAWSVDVDHRAPAREDEAPSRLLSLPRAGGRLDAGHVQLLHRDQAMPAATCVCWTAKYGVCRAAALWRRCRDAGRGGYPDAQTILSAAPTRCAVGTLRAGTSVGRRGGCGRKTLFTLTGETRVAIAPRISIAAFAEAGRVWQKAWTIHPRDLLYDAGPGVRVTTPFGVIRVDLGYQLNRLEGLRLDGEPEKHRWRINLGIGEAF
jgi:outer membrane protein assembly factor BamA